ncbi:MAG: type II toxin-antitoxin system RelE/ParE family toxin [Methylobacter sp.]|nr:type II toxin-antitoxin system RelE/ParE family toxin [Methylobacter sp.]
MAWTIKILDSAKQDLKKLDKPIQQRIASFLRKRLADTDDPKLLGKALQGQYAGYWRYRVGDYRLICHLKNEELIIIVVEIGHRKDIYR